MNTGRKFSLRRTRREESDLTNQTEKNPEKDSKWTEVRDNNHESRSGNSKNEDVNNPGEKRKLEQDDDDLTDDEEPIQVLKKKDSLKRPKLSSVLDDSDSDEIQGVNKKGSKRSPDGLDDPSPKRMASTSLVHNVRLSRQYRNARCRPTTLKEAMKANLYFAPPGVNIPTYTRIILRMFEKYRRQLYKAQSRVKTLLPWGPPVVAGSRQGGTLDPLPVTATASVGSRGSAFVRGTLRGETITDVRNQSEQDMFERRRTLRSSTNPVMRPTASSSTSKSTSTTKQPTLNIDSDSDDDKELMKSYLDELSVTSSTKKRATSFARNGKMSDFVETQKLRKAGAAERATAKTQTSNKDGVNSSVRPKNDGKDENKKPTNDEHRGSNLLADDNVNSDFDSDGIQSNTIDSSAQRLENESTMIKNSGKTKSELDSETTGSKHGILTESKEIDDELCLMDADLENQGDVIRPPKRRSILRPFDDESTDDSDASQPMFSLRFPGNETSVDYEMLASRDESRSEAETDCGGQGGAVEDPLVSQTPTLPSESQAMLGKSILEEMATDADELLHSQRLCDADASSSKVMKETVGECEDTEVSSSAASSSVKQREKPRFMEEDNLAVDADAGDSQRTRRGTRSEAAERAAAAAEERQQQKKTRRGWHEPCSSSSQDHFSVNQPREIVEDTQMESTVQCPLCFEHFTSKEIEAHASDCQGPPPRSEPGPSFTSVPAGGANKVYRTVAGEKGELKNLQVVLQRSPMARQKLHRKATQESYSAKRNLDFDANLAPSGSLDQCSSSRSFDRGSRKPSRNTKGAPRADPESEESGYEKDKEVGSPGVYSWLDMSSPEKKRPARTYGSSVGGNSPKLGDDYIPLDIPEEIEDNGSTEKTSKEPEHKQASYRTVEVESGSDSSVSSGTCDDNLMLQYGAQRVSARSKEPRKVETQETDENEIALAILSNRGKKRPLSLSKSSQAKKSRRPRDSDSEDSDELHVVCELCNDKIPKELYLQHVDKELEARKRAARAPRKVEVTFKDKRQGSSKDEQRRFGAKEKSQIDIPSQSAAAEDTDEHDVDWDGVSDSPIKCFQFTENSNSVVDFENQFEHLKESKGNKRRSNYGQNNPTRGQRGGYGGPGSRGGYRGSGGNKGSYRGSYNKVYGRGKKYKKYRGSRGRK